MEVIKGVRRFNWRMRFNMQFRYWVCLEKLHSTHSKIVKIVIKKTKYSKFTQAQESLTSWVSFITYWDPGSCWKSYEIVQGETGYVTRRVLWLLSPSGVFQCQNHLTVNINLGCRLLTAIEAHRNLVKTWCNQNQYAFIFFPKEIFRTRIDALNFPRNLACMKQLPSFPHPSCHTVFRTQRLCNQRLVIHQLLKPCLLHKTCHLFLYCLKCSVYIT